MGFSKSGTTGQTEVSSDNPNYNEFVKLFNAVKELNGKLNDYIAGVQYTEEDLSNLTQSEIWAAGYLYKKTLAPCTIGMAMGISGADVTPCVKPTVYPTVLIALEEKAAGEYVKLQAQAKVLRLFVGLVPGTIYYTSTFAGVLTNVTGGQKVGIAMSDSELLYIGAT